MIDSYAIDSYAETTKLRTQLVEAYRKLPVLERTMVQLFSVIYGSVSRPVFVECLNKTSIRNQNNKLFLPASIKPYINKLLEQGVLSQERGLGPQCHSLIVEIATRDAVKHGVFPEMVKAVETCLPVRTSWNKTQRLFSSDNEFIREVRIGLYRKDLTFIDKQFEDYSQNRHSSDRLTKDEIFQLVCNNPFDKDWLLTLPEELYTPALVTLLEQGMLQLWPMDEALSCLQEICARPKRSLYSDELNILLAEQLLFRGRLEEAQHCLARTAQEEQKEAAVVWGWLWFLQGNQEQAIAYYRHALQSLKKTSGKRKAYFNSVAGVFFILVLLKERTAPSLQEAEEYATLMARQSSPWLGDLYRLLVNVIKIQQGYLSLKPTISHIDVMPIEAGNSVATLLSALCIYWVDSDAAKFRLLKVLERLYQQAEQTGYNWLAMETAELLSRLRLRGSYGKEAADFRQVHGDIPTVVDVIQHQEAWQLCLSALSNLSKAPQDTPTLKTSQRLAWFISLHSGSCILQPREQKITAQGQWGKGRPIALRRLRDEPESFGYFTPQDLRVCQQIESYYSTSYGYYGGQMEYDFNPKAIAALIGHPLVFWADSPTTRVEIVKGEPELIVKKSKQDWLTLEFSPPITGDQSILVVKETPTRLKVLEINTEHRRIAEIIGVKNQLKVPAAAKDQVLTAINAVSGIVTVHSDIGGGVESAQEVPAEAKPHVHLLPAGGGLKVAVMTRPFAQGGPYFRPGKGGETVIAEIEGQRFQTTRNLREEKNLANTIIAACPVFEEYKEEEGEWLIEDPEDCLELLLDLQNWGDKAVLEWPQGVKLRIAHQAGLNNFKLKINRQQDWFAASGELTLDDAQVIDMQRLLELLAQTPSRFLPLGDGQFIALTQEFRQRLDELRAVSESHGKGTRFHPLAALALEDFIDEVGSVQADEHWKTHIQRIKEMQTLQPELPSTLQGELRDYQIEGFHWLARLSHWGVGACLADDMGLGKTLQALAVILTRATAGPTLIVAPTSVGMNWIAEAQRFAPTLKPIQFSSGSRQQLLDQLQPFDMLVCTYGLLQQEDIAEMLSKVEWQTIVLDEAQAIKNFATKRSKAAMNLQGGFKLITTGTPIENHLGELWNLFRFINPGLLGSLEHFNERFANPIERYQDKPARNKLKKLIQPFLLRRTKNQVLQELPSRTEITLQVELSPEEVAFYEALRREAIAKLADSDAAAGAKHLQVLAEIMKLRRACCNSRLVMPEAQLPSAKLQLFGEVLSELLDNRHKALVFSQFVDHLQIIRDYLESQKIHYQYLDGSTPAKDRQKGVEAFQAGEGDVFLISLKAGGTGLNLTAADYVIHMDPWWNPAVEDQASDRAHRIGQQRPVTIYRLVAKDTIEEKIVNLHQHKRDLADSLLEGSDMSGKVSTDDLLRLIQER